jgi:hypothetical protein
MPHESHDIDYYSVTRIPKTYFNWPHYYSCRFLLSLKSSLPGMHPTTGGCCVKNEKTRLTCPCVLAVTDQARKDGDARACNDDDNVNVARRIALATKML